MIHLDYRDSRPIYEQVKDGLRRLMVTGGVTAGALSSRSHVAALWVSETGNIGGIRS